MKRLHTDSVTIERAVFDEDGNIAYYSPTVYENCHVDSDIVILAKRLGADTAHKLIASIPGKVGVQEGFDRLIFDNSAYNIHTSSYFKLINHTEIICG